MGVFETFLHPITSLSYSRGIIYEEGGVTKPEAWQSKIPCQCPCTSIHVENIPLVYIKGIHLWLSRNYGIMQDLEHVYASLTSALNVSSQRQLSMPVNFRVPKTDLSNVLFCHFLPPATVPDSTEVTVQHMTCISMFI